MITTTREDRYAAIRYTCRCSRSDAPAEITLKLAEHNAHYLSFGSRCISADGSVFEVGEDAWHWLETGEGNAGDWAILAEEFSRARREGAQTLKSIEERWTIDGDYAPDSPEDDRHPVERRLAAMQDEILRLQKVISEAGGSPVMAASARAMPDEREAKWRELDAQRLEQIRQLTERAERAEALLDNAAKTGARDAVQRDEFGERLIESRKEWILHIDRVLAGAYGAGVLDSWLWHQLDHRLKRYGEQHGHPAEHAYRADKWDMSERPKTAAAEWREKFEDEVERHKITVDTLADTVRTMGDELAEIARRAAELEEEGAQLSREVEAALEHTSEQDDMIARLTEERDAASHNSGQIAGQLLDARNEIAALKQRALKAEGWAEGNANALVNVSGQLGVARHELQRVQQAAAQVEHKGAGCPS